MSFFVSGCSFLGSEGGHYSVQFQFRGAVNYTILLTEEMNEGENVFKKGKIKLNISLGNRISVT